MLQTTQSDSQTIDIKTILIPPATLTDEEIIANIQSGDINAYGSLMRRYNQRIFRVARSFVGDDATAMDIVQEAHIKAYTKLDAYRGNGSFLTWLASITRNEALMYLRKHKKEVVMNEETLQIFDSAADTKPKDEIRLPDTVLENKQLKTLLNQNMDQLPEDFRTVFVLRAIEQMSVKETATILGIKEETVKTRYFRAKRLLRAQIQTYLDASKIQVYEFGGSHCDKVVCNVLCHLTAQFGE